MNESHPTCNKRFAILGIPQTEEARRVYRELIITTSGLGESIYLTSAQFEGRGKSLPSGVRGAERINLSLHFDGVFLFRLR